MDFIPRQLAFLEHEMQQIKDDPEREGSERSHASSVLGKVEGELEFKEEQSLNGQTDAEELFS